MPPRGWHAPATDAGTPSNGSAGAGVTVKASEADTGGLCTVWEGRVPPGTVGAGPHVHRERDEFFYVLEGELVLRLGDAFYGYGDYAQAAELYRAALQKSGVDASLVNMRLGEALARAGQRAEAEAAFQAVTGPRAELASLWRLWLSQRA